MLCRKRARERPEAVPRDHLPTKVARKNEDSEDDFLPEFGLGSPTLPSESNIRSDFEERPDNSAERKIFFNDLLNALDSPSHKKYGSFASCEAVKYSQGLIMQSFHVEGAGELHVPLSAEDVSKLRDVCEKPQCFEIDASKITFVGAPEFLSNTIQPLAMHAVRKLGRHGAAAPLSVQLQKLFLCDTDVCDTDAERDSFPCHEFSCRRDIGDEKGLFASMVLQIPTEDGYEGGGLVVRHKNSRKTFDCHLVSSVGFCYSVCFADCKQEWKKIKSGTRLCMIFNLFRQDSSVQALHRDFVASRVREVESVLQPWLSDVVTGKCDTYGPKLAIPLRYCYGKDELFFDEVKGDDRMVLDVLKTCRDENGKQLLDLHLCVIPDSTWVYIGSHWSSPLFALQQTRHDRSALCDRHHGDSDKHNYHAHDWTIENEDEESDGRQGYDEHILAARTVSDQDVSDHGKSKIIFWVGEEDNLTRALGHLGLAKREVVVGGRRDLDEDEERDGRQRLRHVGYCRRWCHRAVLVLWPRELSISIFCETNLSLAVDLLELTVKITDPEFCKHLLRILCWCDTNASWVWAMNCKFDVVTRLLRLCTRAKDFRIWRYDCDSDVVTPTLFQLCTRAGHLKDVLQHVFKLFAKGYRGIGIMNNKVAKELAGMIQVYGWTMCSSLILELVKQWSLCQGQAFIRLAKELFLIHLKDVGTIVAKTTIEVFEARITELEGETAPRFSWCQPRAQFPSNSIIENFLKGPERRFTSNDFETSSSASEFLHRLVDGDVDGDMISGSGNLFNGTVIDENGKFVVELCKTTLHYEIAVERWKRIPDQLFALRNRLRRIKSSYSGL